MAKIYANLIRDGVKTIDDVPAKPASLLPAVKKLLDEIGIEY